MNENPSPLPSGSCAADPARVYALVPCAGSGSRSGAILPKQYHMLAGQRLVDHTVEALLAVSSLHQVLVVLSPDDSTVWPLRDRLMTVHVGGQTRAESVRNGLAQLRSQGARDWDWVLVHDAARCLLRPEDVESLITACQADPVGGLLALPLADTLKSERTDHGVPRVAATLEREGKWQAQTPQMFRLGVLWAALEQAAAQGFAGITDEASAIEALGQSPRLVMGRAQNIKVTYPDDFALAESVLLGRRSAVARQPLPTERAPAHMAPPFRIGEGWDLHVLVPGRPLILGGVQVPHHSGLLGHSDADALLHAVTDALLGAAGLGDIGTHFSDRDPQWAGADSARLLQLAMVAVREAGWQPVNVDTTVVAQAPKLAPYKAAMRARIAELLGLDVSCVNVKAKTAEHQGPVGEGRCMEARAVALLVSV